MILHEVIRQHREAKVDSDFRSMFSSMRIGGPSSRDFVLAQSRKIVEKLWIDGILPFQKTKTSWVVGYRVEYRHMSGVSYHPVMVGPKRPRQYRPEHVVARSFDAWGNEQS